MAFGLLGSIIPQINRNEVVYTSPASTLTVGKVSVSSKNFNPVKVRVGITTDDLNVEYLSYNRFVNYGETFQTDSIHVGEGQKLVVRSDNPHTNFIFYGQTTDETALSQKSGLFNSVVSSDKNKKFLFTPPDEFRATVTLSVCNLNSLPAKARVGLGSTTDHGTFDSSEYLEYDVEIGPNQTYTRTGIKLSPPQTLVCSSSAGSTIDFVVHGQLEFTGTGDVGSPDLIVNGNTVITGSLGVGTAFPRKKFDLIGSALIENDLVVGAGITAKSFSGSGAGLTSIPSSELTGALPAIDGSALVGVVASGTGIVITNFDTPVGTAQTINLTKNLQATFAAGIATVSTTPNVDVEGDFSVNVNKFTVDALSGNVAIAGSLGISSSLTVSGTVNALNNRVINVSAPTTATDAANRKFVDTRSIAMSIALS